MTFCEYNLFKCQVSIININSRINEMVNPKVFDLRSLMSYFLLTESLRVTFSASAKKNPLILETFLVQSGAQTTGE